MQIHLERPRDAAAIRAVTKAAFDAAPYTSHTEAEIVEALREAAALTLSIVARQEDTILGHAAFSPVRINGEPGAWYGLGPISVRPDCQRQGVGSAMMREGLHRLMSMKAEGCVVFGDPRYYGRFGFICDPHLRYAGAPDGYFQRLAFEKDAPQGYVTYHSAFAIG